MPVVKKVEDTKNEDNPQILEMQQAMQEMSKQLAAATELISNRDTEITDMRAASTKIVEDKLAKEMDLKDKFGVKTPTSAKKSPEDLNALTNVEMFEIIGDAVEGVISANREEAGLEIEKGFKNLDDKFDSMAGHIMKSEATAKIVQIRSDNPDFDDYQEDIQKVLKQHQSFSIENAYDWVKMQEKKGDIAAKHTASEKPDKDLSSADEAVERTKKQPEGRKLSPNRQFRLSLLDAIDRVQARRGGIK